MSRLAEFTIADSKLDIDPSRLLADNLKLGNDAFAFKTPILPAAPKNSSNEVLLPKLTIQDNTTIKPDTASPPKEDAPEKIPETGEFQTRLARAVLHQAKTMKGTGHCAKAVQFALARVGMPEFWGTGNAWEMLSELEDSGKFVRIPESEATVGDLIVRPPSTVRARHSKYGDISVVTARHGDKIKQTNDATFDFVRDNPRYDGQAVFLRYKGQQPSLVSVCEKTRATK
jgi:hypothetical protein